MRAEYCPAGSAEAAAKDAAGAGVGCLLLEVVNTGAEIPAARMEHLFEPFGDSTTGGSGLGLWVTDQAVRQLGGTIIVDSNPITTRFEVALPCEEDV